MLISTLWDDLLAILEIIIFFCAIPRRILYKSGENLRHARARLELVLAFPIIRITPYGVMYDVSARADHWSCDAATAGRKCRRGVML